MGGKSKAERWRAMFDSVISTEGDLANSLDDEEWTRITAFAENPNFSFAEREDWLRIRLWLIGEHLVRGWDLPDGAKSWIGLALKNIASGEDPEKHLGLKAPQNRPKQVARTWEWAAQMVWLTHQGKSQTVAADLVAEKEGLRESRKIIQAHNDLRNRRGVFRLVSEVVIEEKAGRYVGIVADYDILIFGVDPK